jgi:hypothetical protein
LANKSCGLLLGDALGIQSESADVCVRRRAILAIVPFDLTNLHHFGNLLIGNVNSYEVAGECPVELRKTDQG